VHKFKRLTRAKARAQTIKALTTIYDQKLTMFAIRYFMQNCMCRKRNKSIALHPHFTISWNTNFRFLYKSTLEIYLSFILAFL